MRQILRNRKRSRNRIDRIGPLWLSTSVVTFGIVFWILFVLTVTVTPFSMNVIREIWATPGSAGFTVFWALVVVTTLLGCLTLSDLLLGWLNPERREWSRYAAHTVILILLALLARNLYEIGSMPLDDTWFTSVVADEPEDVHRRLLGRVLSEQGSGCISRVELCLLVRLENGERANIAVPDNHSFDPSEIMIVARTKGRFSGELGYEFEHYVEVDDADMFEIRYFQDLR